jgi:uncharacterized membrane protein YsdA (DUF1294 family)
MVLSTALIVFLIAYFIVNLVAFIMYGVDKRRAIKEEWRISEASLLTVSFFGAVGALAGMKAFRHKTQKRKFKVVYLFLIINLMAVVYLLIKL